MFKRFLAIIAACLTIHATPLRADSLPVPDPKAEPASTGTTTEEILTDAAIATLIIAGSIALYKARGRPCACPSDTMRNGQACGGRSAWSKAGGAKPLCFPTDITSEMISTYRATKAVPPVW